MIKTILSKKWIFLSSFFNIFFILIIGILFADKKDNWVSKINDKHQILLDELETSYRLNILMSTLNSLLPVPQEDLDKLLNDKSKKSIFLKNLENQLLIIQKAKEKNLFNPEEINRDANGILDIIKTQLIIKEFVHKFLYPKISITKEEISKTYNDIVNSGNQELKKYPVKEGKLIIENKLKNEKLNLKFSQYVEKLRLEAKIVQNIDILK